MQWQAQDWALVASMAASPAQAGQDRETDRAGHLAPRKKEVLLHSNPWAIRPQGQEKGSRERGLAGYRTQNLTFWWFKDC